jgi:alpha-L-rhamnosidase
MKRLIATIAVLMIPATTVIARVETTKLGGSGGFVDGLSVDGLRCEYLVNPIGIDVETPRLSWGLIDAKSVCGQQQMGYQILIATSLAKLNDRDADVWNSGKVVSNQSHLVACEGAGLRSGGDYYWKVRVYDRDGRVSAWSKTARFSMGLLDRSDWKGEWIKHPAAAPEKHIWFRKNVSTDSKATSAFVYIASVGYHILYVNGRQADERILAPALTRFDRRVLYVTYDVAHLLKKGDNTIAVWYAPGWSNHRNITSSMNQTFLLQLSGTTVKNELI